MTPFPSPSAHVDAESGLEVPGGWSKNAPSPTKIPPTCPGELGNDWPGNRFTEKGKLVVVGQKWLWGVSMCADTEKEKLGGGFSPPILFRGSAP